MRYSSRAASPAFCLNDCYDSCLHSVECTRSLIALVGPVENRISTSRAVYVYLTWPVMTAVDRYPVENRIKFRPPTMQPFTLNRLTRRVLAYPGGGSQKERTRWVLALLYIFQVLGTPNPEYTIVGRCQGLREPTSRQSKVT